MEAPPKMVKPPSHYIQAAQLIYTRNIEWRPNTGIFQRTATKELHASGGYTVGREAEIVWGMLHQGRGREEKKRSDEIEEERKRGTHEHPNEFKPDNSAHDTSTNEWQNQRRSTCAMRALLQKKRGHMEYALAHTPIQHILYHISPYCILSYSILSHIIVDSPLSLVCSVTKMMHLDSSPRYLDSEPYPTLPTCTPWLLNIS